MSDILVVVPTCRGYVIPYQTIPVDWCIVHDRQEWPIAVEKYDGDVLVRPSKIQHLVAPSPSLYGERTSAIRQAGLDYGYDEGYRQVLTLDDDCRIPENWAESHSKALDSYVPVVNNTVPDQVIRGFPSSFVRPVGISHGLWSGVLDYPAWYQLQANPGSVTIEDKGWSKIATPFPMCGMNVGFRREVLPAVFFQHTFLRHDDIFAGWMAQRVLDILGYGFASGGAVVQHERASDPTANLAKEKPGDAINAALLAHTLGFSVTHYDCATTYERLVQHVANLRVGDGVLDQKIQDMARSMLRWARRNR